MKYLVKGICDMEILEDFDAKALDINMISAVIIHPDDRRPGEKWHRVIKGRKVPIITSILQMRGVSNLLSVQSRTKAEIKAWEIGLAKAKQAKRLRRK